MWETGSILATFVERGSTEGRCRSGPKTSISITISNSWISAKCAVQYTFSCMRQVHLSCRRKCVLTHPSSVQQTMCITNTQHQTYYVPRVRPQINHVCVRTSIITIESQLTLSPTADNDEKQAVVYFHTFLHIVDDMADNAVNAQCNLHSQ